jgi:hypothetical protein
MYDANEKNILKKKNSSNEAIKFFGLRRFWWVGRKGEAKKYFILGLTSIT